MILGKPKAIITLPKQEIRSGEAILIPPAYVEISGVKPEIYRAVITEDMIVELPKIDPSEIEKRVIFTIFDKDRIHIKKE